MNDQFSLESEEDYQRPTPTLDEVIATLKSGGDAVPDETIIYGLSELTDDQILALRPTWLALDTTYRQILMGVLADEMDSNYELDYQAIGELALDDSDDQVRRSGIELLSESEDLEVMDRLIRIVSHDNSDDVRAEAMRVLGNFILLGELGDIDEDETKQAQKLALSLYKNDEEDTQVRARSLEALANCSYGKINQMIEESYRGHDEILKIAAIVAMGRTADNRWEDIILEELEIGLGDIQVEAARASGELQLKDAVPHLAVLLKEGDRDAQQVCIWALGEIGGKEASRVLENASADAEEAEDDEMIELIEDALGNANFAGSGKFFNNVDLS
jgi:HEAT repeat protein